MAGPSDPATDQSHTNSHPQKNPLRFDRHSTRGLKKKKRRARLTNFAQPPAQEVDLTSDPDLEVVRPVQFARRAQSDEAIKHAQLKPATLKPAAPTPTVSADFNFNSQPTPPVAATEAQPADVIDLTIDSPVLAPMKPTATYSKTIVNALPSINAPPRSHASATRAQQQTWSRTPAGHIQLPEPRQSHSAGYHGRHRGPRYKVLPAGFGGLDLARSHFGSEKNRGSGDGEEKVRRDIEYTLKRHVEEYWR